MKEIIACVGMLLLTTFSGDGQTSNNQGQRQPQMPTKAEREVLARHQAWCDAIGKGEMETLDQPLADDYIITSSNGALRDKQAADARREAARRIELPSFSKRMNCECAFTAMPRAMMMIAASPPAQR
ncbi:MAG: nuclear transport factor 2 family protein [Blastocatellia bacterium]